MTREQRNELIMACLSKRVDIDIERAYDIAVMAVEGRPPDMTFSEEECLIYEDYRTIVRGYQH